MPNTLFSHLAQKFSVHPENLATEALLYLLTNARSANDIFENYCSPLRASFEPIVRFSSQVSSEGGSIPDLVGTDAEGRNVFIIENKFWAELTPNQPLGYLPLLPRGKTNALFFICPEKRLAILHDELNRLLSDSDQYRTKETVHRTGDVVIDQIRDSQYMVTVSWRRLLSDLETVLDPIEERTLIADLKQLQGLCERMDQEGFIPLRPSETGNLEIPRRVMDYRGLVDDMAAKLVGLSEANIDGLRPAASSYSTGKYMELRKKGEFQALLAVDFALWRSFGHSPIWLKFHHGKYGRATEVAALLSKTNLYFENVQEDYKAVATPILLTPSSARHRVIQDGADQIRAINKILLD